MTTDTTPAGGRDPMQLLTALRPTLDIDQTWDTDDQAAVRDAITGGPHDELAARRRRRHRPAAVLAVGSLIVLGSAGVAVGAGLVPQQFVDAFSYWNSPGPEPRPLVDPSHAERVATAPGPDGTVFSVVVARADEADYHCTTALFETAQSATDTGPSEFVNGYGSSCDTGPDTGTFGQFGGVSMSDDYYVWSYSAGAATSAELVASDGQRYPAVLVDGRFYGWYPAPPSADERGQLIGYAADGAEVGRVLV